MHCTLDSMSAQISKKKKFVSFSVSNFIIKNRGANGDICPPLWELCHRMKSFLRLALFILVQYTDTHKYYFI